MIKIIREAQTAYHVQYYINFDITSSGGYSFPCNHDGEPIGLSEVAMANLEKCRSGEVKTYRPPYIKEVAWASHSPAIGECHCGGEVEMSPDNEGLCYCSCGAIYNTAGQSIRPRSEWEERYDDDY